MCARWLWLLLFGVCLCALHLALSVEGVHACVLCCLWVLWHAVAVFCLPLCVPCVCAAAVVFAVANSCACSCLYLVFMSVFVIPRSLCVVRVVLFVVLMFHVFPIACALFDCFVRLLAAFY